MFTSANEACASGTSTADFEPSFSALLDYILAAPKCRVEAVALIRDGMRRGSIEWELIAYLMHELRWPEIEVAARSQLAEEADPRNKNVMSHILAAFSDDWSDADMYRR